jgi:hypothetical protein
VEPKVEEGAEETSYYAEYDYDNSYDNYGGANYYGGRRLLEEQGHTIQHNTTEYHTTPQNTTEHHITSLN